MPDCIHQGSRRSCCAEYYICRQHKQASCVKTVATFVQLRQSCPIEQLPQFDSMVICCETCTEFTADSPENSNSAFPEEGTLRPVEAGG